MSDFDDYTPDVDLDINSDIPEEDDWDSLTDNEIDDILGKENTDTEGLGQGIGIKDDDIDDKDPKKKKKERVKRFEEQKKPQAEEQNTYTEPEEISVHEELPVEPTGSTVVPETEIVTDSNIVDGSVSAPFDELPVTEGVSPIVQDEIPDSVVDTPAREYVPVHSDILFTEEPAISPIQDQKTEPEIPEDSNFIHQKVLVADADIQTTEAHGIDAVDTPTIITSGSEEYYEHQHHARVEFGQDSAPQRVDNVSSMNEEPVEYSGFIKQHVVVDGESMREDVSLNIDDIPDKVVAEMVVPKTVAFFDSKNVAEVNNFSINNMPMPESGANYAPGFMVAVQNSIKPVGDTSKSDLNTRKEDNGFINQHVITQSNTFRGADGSMPASSNLAGKNGCVETKDVNPEIVAKMLPKGVCPKCGGLAGACACVKSGEGSVDKTDAKKTLNPNKHVEQGWGADYVNLKGYNKGAGVSKAENVGSAAVDGVRRIGSTIARGDNSDTASGIREAKDSTAFQVARILLSTTGMSGVYHSMKYHSEDIAKGAMKAESLIGSQKISLETLTSRKNIVEAVKNGSISKVESAPLLLHRKSIYDKLQIKDDLLKMPGLSDKERDFLNSKDFFYNKSPKKYGRIIDKSFARDNNLNLSANVSSLNAKGLKKLSKQDVLTPRQKAKLKDLARAKKMANARRAGNRVRSATGKTRRITSMLFVRALSKDETFGKSISAIRMAKNVTRGALKVGIKGSRLILKVTGISYLARWTGGKLVGVVKQRVIRPMSAKASEGVKVAKTRMSSVAHTAQKKFNKTKPGQAINKAKHSLNEAVSTVKNVGQHFANTKPMRFITKSAKKTARVAKKTGQAVGKGTKIAGRVLSLPFRFVGGALNVLNWLKRKIILIAGVFIIGFVILYMVAGALINLTQGVGVGISSISKAKELARIVKEVHETVINYDHYKDMQEDIDMLLEMDEETYEKAEELGQGHPITDTVLEGHHIDEYGCPDKEKGYTIHYLDAYGNEISSRASNIKDIEALCVAMVSNEIGHHKSYKKDLKAFDDLLKDMYELMVYHDPETGDPFTYEETEIYTCLEGCDEYFYYCNDYSYYSTYYQYMADGCGHYDDPEPYNPQGCCERTVAVDGYYYENGDFYTEEECEEWEDPSLVDDLLEEGLFVRGVGYETEYYCPGHTVPICYGHRDIDINITLYDVEYAIENDIYPENWKTASYRYMIQEFMKKGRWSSSWYSKIARNYFGGDWYDLYGILIEGAEFGTGETLSEEQIEKIMEMYDGDVGMARQALINFGLQYVGKIGYGWGDKAGSGTPSTLDCSGFVNWVFREALGTSVPASTGAWANYKTESYSQLKPGDLGFIFMGGSNASTGTYNHIGIYCGKNDAGQDLWLHCSSGGHGVVINTTNVFRKYVDPFAQ